jgi:hypothetical protein
VLGDILRIRFFDHGDAGVMQRRNEPDRQVGQQHSHNRAVSQRVHRDHSRIEPDCGDDIVDVPVIALARIVAQALPSPWVSSGASSARFSAAVVSCTVIGTE